MKDYKEYNFKMVKENSDTKILEELSNKKIENKKSYASAFIKYLSKEFKIKGKVLDIGSGRGEYKKPFEDAGLRYTGVDAEPEKDFIYQSDITKDIPFQDDSFDLVFMRYVIEHIEKGTNTTNTINEIKRVLKPGGMIVIITSDWTLKYKTFYDTFDHISPYTKMSIQRLLEYSGIKTILCRDYINIPFIWRYFPIISFKYKVKRNGIIYIGTIK